MEKRCLFCTDKEVTISVEDSTYSVNCPKCGKYKADHIVWDFKESWLNYSARERANISAWIRQNEGINLTQEYVDDFKSTDSGYSASIGMSGVKRFFEQLKTLSTKSVGERADRLLLHISHKYSQPGQLIPYKYSSEESQEWMGISGCIDIKELKYIVLSYLNKEKQYITKSPDIITIAPRGWDYIHTLKTKPINSNICFVAMEFDNYNKSVIYPNAIKPSIIEAGYEPFMMNENEKTENIYDTIISNIRKSKFLIADLSFGNKGVYFEAGFAMGQEKRVIYICRKTHFKNPDIVHFDVKQLNTIIFNEKDIDYLRERLVKRIEANFGHGAYNNKH